MKDDVPETSSVKDDVARDQQESEMVHHDENWVESVAFCKDPTLSLAATATLEGKLFIWDVSKQVLFFTFVVKLSSFKDKVYQRQDSF